MSMNVKKCVQIPFFWEIQCIHNTTPEDCIPVARMVSIMKLVITTECQGNMVQVAKKVTLLSL